MVLDFPKETINEILESNTNSKEKKIKKYCKESKSPITLIFTNKEIDWNELRLRVKLDELGMVSLK